MHNPGLRALPDHPSDTDRELTPRSRTVVSARKLHRRATRARTGTFLAEGPQAVGEALRAGAALHVLVTAAARERHAGMLAASPDVPVDTLSEASAQSMAGTMTPQGMFAVCRTLDRPWESLLAQRLTLGTMLVADRDPGNVGTVIRTADAVGAEGVFVSTQSVDVYNPKAVRASAGSVFHVPHAVEVDPDATVDRARSLDMQVLAADADGPASLAELVCDGARGAPGASGPAGVRLATPTLWLFGSEAHGLPPSLRAQTDLTVRIPIYGRAESLNVSVAAALCLYASAFAQRGRAATVPRRTAASSDRAAPAASQSSGRAGVGQ